MSDTGTMSLADVQRQLRQAKREAERLRWPHKCCRCWPSWVTDEGFCTCCEYDHTKDERAASVDPDYFDETQLVEPQSSDDLDTEGEAP